MSTKPFVVSTSTHDYHLKDPSTHFAGSPQKIRQASASPEKKNKTGIKVTTAPKTNLEMASYQSDDPLHDVEVSAFASRCSKIDPFHYNFDSVNKASNKPRNSIHGDLFEKLKTLHKVRVFRRFENKEENGTNIRNIKYCLEDADEHLDLLLNDDDTFHLGCLSFEVPTNTSALDIKITKQKIQNTHETNITSHNDIFHEFELGNIALLKNKLTEIRLSKEKGGVQTLGKVEYRLRKFRIFDQKDKLVFKILRQQSLDPKTNSLSIRDDKDNEFVSVTITHLSSLTSKCDIAFPKKCDSMKKLLLIGTLLIILERVEVDQGVFEEQSPPKNIFNSLFEFLTCQS